MTKEWNQKCVPTSKNPKNSQETVPIWKWSVSSDTKTYPVDHYWDPSFSNERPRNLTTRRRKRDLNPTRRPIRYDKSLWWLLETIIRVGNILVALAETIPSGVRHKRVVFYGHKLKSSNCLNIRPGVQIHLVPSIWQYDWSFTYQL